MTKIAIPLSSIGPQMFQTEYHNDHRHYDRQNRYLTFQVTHHRFSYTRPPFGIRLLQNSQNKIEIEHLSIVFLDKIIIR